MSSTGDENGPGSEESADFAAQGARQGGSNITGRRAAMRDRPRKETLSRLLQTRRAVEKSRQRREKLADQFTEQASLDDLYAQARSASDAAALKARRRITLGFLLWVTGGAGAALLVTFLVLSGEIAKVSAPSVTLLVGLLTALVTITAFVLTPLRLKRIETSLTLVDRQLAELWGPLLGMLKTSETVYDGVLAELNLDPRDRDYSTDRKNPDSTNSLKAVQSSLDPFAFYAADQQGGGSKWKTWNRAIEGSFLMSNKRIAALITRNYHLIGQDQFDDMSDFLLHQAEFEITFRNVQRRVKANRHVRKELLTLEHKYPATFEYHVYHKVRFLISLQRKYRLELEGIRKIGAAEFWAAKASFHRVLAGRPVPLIDAVLAVNVAENEGPVDDGITSNMSESDRVLDLDQETEVRGNQQPK